MYKSYELATYKLGPSINGLVTDGIQNYVFEAVFQRYFKKNDSEHTRDYKRLPPVCEAEILRVSVKIIEVFSSLNVDF